MKVIFVCTGNTCRSPMAEMLMRKYCKDNKINIEVESRGLACSNGRPISEGSRMALAELGINSSEHISKSFTMRDLFEADLIVAMTKNHKDAIVHYFNGGDNVKTFDEITKIGDVADPYNLSLDVYRECRDKINQGVKIIANNLAKNI